MTDQRPPIGAGVLRRPITWACCAALALHALLLLLLHAAWQREADAPPRPATLSLRLAPPVQPTTAPASVPSAPSVPRATSRTAAPTNTRSTAETPGRRTDEAPRTSEAQAQAPTAADVVPEAPAPAPAERPALPTPAASAASVPSSAPSPSPALADQSVVLFAPDGRLRVPTAVLQGEPPPVPSWVAAPHAPAPWEQRSDPLVYEPTMLEPIWKPDRESVLEEFVRLNTRSRTFKTPWGTKVQCSWVLIVGGCAW